MKWPNISLGEICSPKQHRTISLNQLADTGYPVFGANGQIGFYSAYTHDSETIAITCRGATCGTVNIVPAYCYITGNAMALDHLDHDRVYIRYLAYALQKIGLKSVISGSAQPQITRGPLCDLMIPFPPLEEQKRIAEILDQADALRRLRQRAIDRLNTLGQAIFYEMFGDPLINPMGWPKEKCSFLCKKITVGIVVKPASYYRESGIPAIRGTNIKPEGINLSDAVYFSKNDNETRLSKTRVWHGDIVIVRSGQPGLAAVVPPEMNGINSIDVLIATPEENKAKPRFLRDLINSPGGKQIVLSESRGQVQQHFNVKSLSKADFIFPPLSLQIEYERKLDALENQIKILAIGSKKLETLFSSLQYRAFRGEL